MKSDVLSNARASNKVVACSFTSEIWRQRRMGSRQYYTVWSDLKWDFFILCRDWDRSGYVVAVRSFKLRVRGDSKA